MPPINDLTPHLALPLPHPDNDLPVDVLRLRDALSALDAAVAAKADTVTLNAVLAEVIDAAPATLNTLRELAAAIGNDPTFAADMAAQLAALVQQLAALAAQLTGQGTTLSNVVAVTERLRLDNLLNLHL